MALARSRAGTLVRRLLPSAGYGYRLANELGFYRDCQEVHDLPPIFHYWSNKYLRPKLELLGLNHPDDLYFVYSQRVHEASGGDDLRIVSLGAGNCDVEISLARRLRESGVRNFLIECVEVNDAMLERAERQTVEEGLSEHFQLTQADINKWQASRPFQICVANQVLHHILELEHVLDQVKEGIGRTGFLLTSDMIGRNGHRRWPEAVKALQPFWEELPERYRYHHVLERVEHRFINYDVGGHSFEGIRAQDILPLLVERFHFDLFIAFANIIYIFIERAFGPNFDPGEQWDRDFVDRVHERDEAGILSGELKPTQILAALCNHSTEVKLGDPRLSPRFCVRRPD